MKSFKIPFAYDNGVIVDKDSAEKGKIYKCNCGADVKLRGGEIVKDHFYHINENITCSLESAIHKAYKDVFFKSKKLRLPFEVNGTEYLTFESIELEKKIDDYIPDAIGYINGKMYLVEFAKTSYIGERKENKIKKSNLFCIEIDIVKNIKTINDIKNHLENECYYKHIINIPEYIEATNLRDKYEADIIKLKLYYNNKINELNKTIDELNKELTLLDIKLNEFKSFKNLKKELNSNNFSLFYKLTCKNNAVMYERKSNNYRMIAFAKNDKIDIKFQELTF